MSVAAPQEVAAGVFCVDVQYPVAGQTCAFVVCHNNKAAVIDCGGKQAPPLVVDALRQCGVSPDAVEWIFPTHAHLDHAGGCGDLARVCPNAVVAAHPSCIKHLIDPQKVLAPAVRGLYGDAYYDEHYAEPLPVPEGRARRLQDEETLVLGGDRRLRVFYAPGHAWNHIAVFDSASGFLAAGDAFGVSYREMDKNGESLIVPVMPPTQFDPTAMQDTIKRIQALAPKTVGVAHFGACQSNVANLARQQLDIMEEWLPQARKFYAEHGRENFYDKMRAHILDFSIKRAVAVGVDEATARKRHGTDAHLSARGFLHLFNKEAAAAAN
jgi:glyoxylase-like metal-dependent hydrolase (beta-lactamase superfamily II)